MIKIKLDKILESRELTISEVSKDTGIARSTITPIVNNPEEVKSIRFATLDKLCDYLNVPLNELIEHVPSEDKFKVIDKYHFKRDEKELFLIEGSIENTLSITPVFISIHPVKVYGREDVMGYKYDIELLHVEEIKELKNMENEIIFDSKKEEAMRKNPVSFSNWIKNMDRIKLRKITIELISTLVGFKNFPRAGKFEDNFEELEFYWSGGHLFFDSKELYTFTFEINYEERLLKDVSEFDKIANAQEWTNLSYFLNQE